MKRLGLTLGTLAALAILAGCGAGKYKHGVGNCELRNGAYRVQIFVARDKGQSDAKGTAILQTVCAATQVELSK